MKAGFSGNSEIIEKARGVGLFALEGGKLGVRLGSRCNMRRRIFVITVCLILLAVVLLTGAACFADGSSAVTVSVTIARVIHVDNTAVAPSNILVLAQVTPGSVTFIAP